MVRSLGFGSMTLDLYYLSKSTPLSDLFSLRFQRISLTKPKTISRRLILQQASGQSSQSSLRSLLPQIDCSRFHNLFHSPPGDLFHLSLAVLCTISDSRVFSLTRWSSSIHKGFHVSQATWDTVTLQKKTGLSPSLVQVSAVFSFLKDKITQSHNPDFEAV